MSDPIRVAIVEDQSEVRDFLRAIVAGTPGLAYVGDFPSAKPFLNVERILEPDLVILDLELPGISGVECARELRARGRRAEILVLTVHDDADWLFPALAAGANGYLVKPIEPATLVDAIRDLHAGGAPMSAPIARRVLAEFRDEQARRAELAALTRREREVLVALTRGLRYREIASELGIEKSTVQRHLHHIYDKLHVHNATAAAARYLASYRPP